MSVEDGSSTAFAPTRVLVVDDDASAISALRQILSSSGYQVTTASGGEGALEELERSEPDLVLTDLHMPGMGGLALLRELKQRGVSVPVILMTSHEAIEPAVAAMREGAADYLSKPLNTDELLIVVERALEAVRIRRESAQLKSQLQDLTSFDEGELIEPQHLPAALARATATCDGLPGIPGASILDFERYAILKTLEATGGSTSKTAALLGISVRKIQYRLQEYRGLGRAESSPPSVRRTAFRAAR